MRDEKAMFIVGARDCSKPPFVAKVPHMKTYRPTVGRGTLDEFCTQQQAQVPREAGVAHADSQFLCETHPALGLAVGEGFDRAKNLLLCDLVL